MITFDLNDPEKGQCQGHPDFERLISHKQNKIGHMLLVNSNRQPHMGSQIV